MPFLPTNAVFTAIDVLLSVRITPPSVIPFFDIDPYQTAISVSASYDALADLFECVTNLLERLHIYTEKIPSFPAMSDIMVKIMIEVLNVVALATEQIKNGRFSEWSATHRSSLADLWFRKIRKETTRRERRRGHPPEIRQTHPGRGEDGWCPYTASRAWTVRQFEGSHER